MNIKDKVTVIRQVGENGIKEKVTGVIEKFSNIITINSEVTAYVKYDNYDGGYYYPLSKILVN